jgi:hypothetical protein
MNHAVTRSTSASRITFVIAVVLVVILCVAPWWGSTATLRLLGQFMVYLALASLWNLLAGYAGLVSVGQQTYVGLGGYSLMSMVMFVGLHPLLAVPIAGLVAVLIALPVGKLVFRLQGIFRHRHLGGGGSLPPFGITSNVSWWRFWYEFARNGTQNFGRNQVLARSINLLVGFGFGCGGRGTCLWIASFAHWPRSHRNP